MFWIVILIALIGVSFYLAHRSRCFFCFLFPRVPRWVYYAVSAFLTLLLVIGFVRSFLPMPSGLKSVLAVINAYWMGIFIYLLIFVLLADLVLWVIGLTKLIPTEKRGLSRFVAGICAIVLTVAVSVYGFWNATRIQTESYDVDLKNSVSGGLNVVMLSDLHLGAVGSEDRLEDIVAAINAQSPDLVCIVGDLFDNDYYAIKDPERAAALLRQIDSKYGVYSCFGNHDAGKTVDLMRDFLVRANICNLTEEYRVIDGRLVLVGRTDRSPIGGNGGTKRVAISDILTGAPDLPVVVMDHNPARIDEYGSEVDLILCGHTHKGQIFPGSLITGAMYEVDYGVYQRDAESPHVVVSSGVGTWGPPMRVGTDSEIVSIRLN